VADRMAITARERVLEGSAQPVVVRFRQGAVDNVPTNVFYRIDDPQGGEVLAWTPLTPAAQVTISIQPDRNMCATGSTLEYRDITVMADKGLPTAFVQIFRYDVKCASGY
jgi:hypothetical protein